MQKDFFVVRHSRIIIIVSIVGILFCILLVVIFSLRKEFSKSTYLSLQFAPANAILTLDNGTELKTGTYKFQPGTYTGIIKADNFKPKTITFDVNDHQSNSVTNYLTHNNEGLTYFEQSASDISTLRLVKNDPEVSSFLETYDQKISIYDKLPLYATWLKRQDDYPTYTIKITDGRNNKECYSTLCLLATGPKNNPDEIAKTLSANGYDINNYKVIYEYSY